MGEFPHRSRRASNCYPCRPLGLNARPG